MIYFESDYTEGAHPEIIKRLMETNMEQTTGYGMDHYCESARNKIKEICGKKDAYVQFLVGGTQTNSIVIASVLKPYQGVVCASTGHINVHETGAVEATGHKVLAIQTLDGKISAENVKEVCVGHFNDANHEHMVQPGMVYISYPTENGLIYTEKELSDLYKACKEYEVPLFIDGARLGYGLMAKGSDMTFAKLADLCDIFYIGGTKVGALFGEAVVIVNPSYQKDFRYMIKRNGAMLAKGRLLGIQFDTLFTDNLYLKIAEHADLMAMKIKEAFIRSGYTFLFDSVTNQQFPILSNDKLKELGEKYSYEVWEKVDHEHAAVRFCTSWATKEEDVDRLIEDF